MPTDASSEAGLDAESGADAGSCGNAILDPGEECDLGPGNGTVCSSLCEEQKVLSASVGGGRSCAILSHGVVKCWGYVYGGFLGRASTQLKRPLAPAPVRAMSTHASCSTIAASNAGVRVVSSAWETETIAEMLPTKWETTSLA